MILIVDDDRSVTASIGLLLKQAGYATHAAASADEAVSWLEGRACDLVIQDMNFSRQTSGEEGLALLARIKAAAAAAARRADHRRGAASTSRCAASRPGPPTS